jgi:phosphomethylpyrimidine synthase
MTTPQGTPGTPTSRPYATQMEAARKGIITLQMETVAQKEHLEPEHIRTLVAQGTVAIPANINHTSLSPEGIGDGLRTKINVNLGISGDCLDYSQEMEKVKLSLSFGVESIMDLSNYGKTHMFRQKLVECSPAMIGTVPMYDAIGFLEKDLKEITAADFLRVIEAHAQEGVDFMTIHAGLNRRAIAAFREQGRTMNIVSRGGSLIFAWMQMTGNENPFYEHYEELLDILRTYDVTISLGDALRPGCLADSTDAAQVSELIELGHLARRAWDHDVQVMIEGPGHMAMDEIAANMRLEKRLCSGAPFYVLGPLVTDIAPGYDHITSAIGGAIAAMNGANFLCYVTPSEHLRLPDVQDVRDGIVASKIAAHAADVANHVPGAMDADNAMADARHRMDWDAMFAIAIDGEHAREVFENAPPAEDGTCTMCGATCAVRTTNRILEGLEVSFTQGLERG